MAFTHLRPGSATVVVVSTVLHKAGEWVVTGTLVPFFFPNVPACAVELPWNRGCNLERTNSKLLSPGTQGGMANL